MSIDPRVVRRRRFLGYAVLLIFVLALLGTFLDSKLDNDPGTSVGYLSAALIAVVLILGARAALRKRGSRRSGKGEPLEASTAEAVTHRELAIGEQMTPEIELPDLGGDGADS